MQKLLSPSQKKFKTLTTTVYSLAAIDKKTYLLLQCTVNVTEKECQNFFERSLSPKRLSKPDVASASPRKSPRLSVRPFSVASTSSTRGQPNPQTTTSGRVGRKTEKEDSSDKLKSEDQLWKPITTMKVPLRVDRSEKACISGDRDPELLKELSKKHFQNQAMIRQFAKSSRASTDDEGASTFQAQGASATQAQESPGQILSEGVMSLVHFHDYLYAIGIVIGGEATGHVRRIKVFREDGRELSYAWERVPSLPEPCPYHASHAKINISVIEDDLDSILVIGGEPSSSMHLIELSFTNNRYDEMAGWQVDYCRNELKIPRMKHCIIAAPAITYVFGGTDKHGVPVLYTEKSANIDALPEDFWDFASPLSHAKVSFVAVCHKKYIYAIGGHHTEDKATVTMERLKCKNCINDPDQWINLNGFQTDTHCLVGCMIKKNICILGGKPKTFDLKSSDDVYSITWNLSPTIDLPTIHFENTVSAVVQVRQVTKQPR